METTQKKTNENEMMVDVFLSLQDEVRKAYPESFGLAAAVLAVFAVVKSIFSKVLLLYWVSLTFSCILVFICIALTLFRNTIQSNYVLKYLEKNDPDNQLLKIYDGKTKILSFITTAVILLIIATIMAVVGFAFYFSVSKLPK